MTVRRHTAETRAKISTTQKKRTRTPEHRAKVRDSMLGNTHARGFKHSPETKAKVSETKRGNTDRFQPLPLGSTRISKGYVQVKTAKPDVWELEHRVIMGVPKTDPRIVHHIDGDKLNNDPTNLQIFESQAAHTSHHHNLQFKRCSFCHMERACRYYSQRDVWLCSGPSKCWRRRQTGKPVPIR